MSGDDDMERVHDEGGGITQARRALGRRTVLRGALALGAGLWTPGLLAHPVPERRIRLANLHTGDRADLVYWRDGVYLESALDRISRVLRDHHLGETRAIDPKLIDILHDVAGLLKTSGPFLVSSAYRAPETNERLRRSNRRVARNSLHTRGMAVDVRLADRSVADLCAAAVDLGRGGVGRYRRVAHLDSGPPRVW